jgi:hypothetical protein
MNEAYKILVETSETKRPTRRWESDIKMDLREMGFEGVDFIHLAQDRTQLRTFVNTAMKFQIS